MVEMPLQSKIALIGIGLAVIVAIVTLAQRLGEWRSKVLARVLGGAAAVLIVFWLYVVGLWLFNADLTNLFTLQGVIKAAIGILLAAALVWSLRFQRRIITQQPTASDPSPAPGLEQPPLSPDLREWLKDQLGKAHKKGEQVYQANDGATAKRWVVETHMLIEKALGSGEAELFTSDAGFTFYSSTGEVRNLVSGRLQRLATLIPRIDGIKILSTFQPHIEDSKHETRADVNTKRPTVILKSIMARLSTFELTARDFDAFEIEIHPLTCKDAVIGWNLPKTVLLSGETMPATICEIGKSGAYYNHAAPLLLEQALDRLTSPDSPVVETSILITYRDAERQQRQTDSPVRYDRRVGKAEFLVPTFSLRNALPVTVDSKTDSTSDQDTFETFKNHLPSAQIAHLRLRDQIFSWNTSADAALATFIRRNAGAENAFLDESLEGLRVKLHERIKTLLDRAYRYTDDTPAGKARRFTYVKNDTATYDKNRDEVINLTQDVVSTYDALILAARKQFAGGRD